LREWRLGNELGRVARGLLELLRWDGDSEDAEVAALAVSDALQVMTTVPEANRKMIVEMVSLLARAGRI
jgi:hypothetical protein